MTRSPLELLAQDQRLFNEYEGAFVENFVAQQLISHFHQPLYYWRSKGGKAELDFLVLVFLVSAWVLGLLGLLKALTGLESTAVVFREDLLLFLYDRKITNLLEG